LGNAIQVVSAKVTGFVADEIAPNITINGGGGPVIVSGSWGIGAVTATGATCAANVSITC
jgi:hypothetical protein